MITTINKDILTVDKGVIVHSVNCIGAVGGLAGAIACKWPENAEKYKKYVLHRNQSITLMGTVFDVKVSDNLYVANLFGQYEIGTSERQTEYSALISGLKRIASTVYTSDEMEEMDFGSLGIEDVPKVLQDVYIPYKIGCGLGGADWNLVEEIIFSIFSKSVKNAYICKIDQPKS